MMRNSWFIGLSLVLALFSDLDPVHGGSKFYPDEINKGFIVLVGAPSQPLAPNSAFCAITCDQMGSIDCHGFVYDETENTCTFIQIDDTLPLEPESATVNRLYVPPS